MLISGTSMLVYTPQAVHRFKIFTNTYDFLFSFRVFHYCERCVLALYNYKENSRIFLPWCAIQKKGLGIPVLFWPARTDFSTV